MVAVLYSIHDIQGQLVWSYLYHILHVCTVEIEILQINSYLSNCDERTRKSENFIWEITYSLGSVHTILSIYYVWQFQFSSHPSCGVLAGMDIKDCPTALENWTYLSDNWNSHPTWTSKIWIFFYAKSSYRKRKFCQWVPGKNVGRWIFSLDKWKLHSLVRHKP